MRRLPLKLPRCFYHSHYEWRLIAGVLAVWTIIFLVDYFGVGR